MNLDLINENNCIFTARKIVLPIRKIVVTLTFLEVKVSLPIFISITGEPTMPGELKCGLNDKSYFIIVYMHAL